MAKTVTVADLKARATALAAEIAAREAADKRITELADMLKKGKYSRMDGLAALDVLFPKPAPAPAAKRPASRKGAKKGNGALPFKYFHPTDKLAKPWAGKARKPSWLSAFLAKGRKLDSFEKVPAYTKDADWTYKQ